MNLTHSDLAQHQALGIDASVLREAKVGRVTSNEARALGIQWGGDLAGVVYPRVDPCSRAVVGYRVRRDTPEIADGKPRNKYLSSRDPHRLYLTCVAEPLLADTTVPIVIVESEKSALMLASVARRTARDLCPIATGGCWSWRGTIGKVEGPNGGWAAEKGPIPDWDLLVLDGRDVVIWFDSNIATNPNVQRACAGLVEEIKRRGGRPRVCRMPVEPGINGPDDFRQHYDDQAVVKLLASATAAGVYKTPTEYLKASGLLALSPGELDGAQQALALLASLMRDESNDVTVQLVREGAKVALKKSGIPSVARLAESATKRVPKEDTPGWLVDDVPARDPIAIPVLLERIVSVIRSLVVLAPAEADAIALWIMVAWLQDHATILPLLYFMSPTKRCGKSTAMTVVASLAPRALLASNISPAALFRVVDQCKPTLLLDEADTFLPANDALRGILNSGHTRPTAVVVRCEGDDHATRIFSTWCPKAVAGIGRPAGTIGDRAITIKLQRKSRSEVVARIRQDRIFAEHQALRSQLRRFADDYGAALAGADPDLPDALHDRARDNWRHAVAIADLAGGDWSQRARAAAVALTGSEDEADDALSVELLVDLKSVWPIGQGWWASASIITALTEMADRPWATLQQGRPLTGAKLARLLRDFDIKVVKRRDGAKTVNAYAWPPIEAALGRYAPAGSGTAEQPSVSNEIRPIESGTPTSSCSVPDAEVIVENVDLFRRSGLTPDDTARDLDLDGEYERF